VRAGDQVPFTAGLRQVGHGADASFRRSLFQRGNVSEPERIMRLDVSCCQANR
jgi:hypothetical protein